MTIDLTRDEIWFLKALRAAGERGRIVAKNYKFTARALLYMFQLEYRHRNLWIGT